MRTIRKGRPLRSEELGCYWTNRFMIHVGDRTPVFRRDGSLRKHITRKALALFVHEYMHYVQNISTVSALRSYVLFQSLLARFSESLDRNGTSRGSAGLAIESCRDVRALLELQSRYDGDIDECLAVGEEAVSVEVNGFRTVDWAARRAGKGVSGQDVVLDCDVTLANRTARRIEFVFGTAAIEEGIAYELDRLVAKGRRLAELPDDAPALPYLVMRALCGHVCACPVSPVHLVSTAVLALDTANPPVALIQALQDADGHADDPSESKKALLKIQGELKEHRDAGVVALLADLDSLVGNYKGRAVAESAMTLLRDVARSMCSARSRDPSFEVRPFEGNTVDDRALQHLLLQCLPCDALQKFRGDERRLRRDVMVAFGPAAHDDGGWDQSERLRVLDCQLDYMLAHLAGDGFLATDQVGPHACPFATACDLGLRKGDPAACFEQPWVRCGENPTCWYGLAVLATLGLVTSRRH